MAKPGAKQKAAEPQVPLWGWRVAACLLPLQGRYQVIRRKPSIQVAMAPMSTTTIIVIISQILPFLCAMLESTGRTHTHPSCLTCTQFSRPTRLSSSHCHTAVQPTFEPPSCGPVFFDTYHPTSAVFLVTCQCQPWVPVCLAQVQTHLSLPEQDMSSLTCLGSLRDGLLGRLWNPAPKYESHC